MQKKLFVMVLVFNIENNV